MNEGDKSISILDSKLGAAFAKAEQDQKILEEKVEKMGNEMPIIKVLNEKIEEMKKAKADEFKGVLYDANGNEIKVKKILLSKGYE